MPLLEPDGAEPVERGCGDEDPWAGPFESAEGPEGGVPIAVNVTRLRLGGKWLCGGSTFRRAVGALETCVPIEPLDRGPDLRPVPKEVTTFWIDDSRGQRFFELLRDETLWTRFNSDGRIWRSSVGKRIYRCAGLMEAFGVSSEETSPP